VARALLRALGESIAAPSANRYQALSPTRAEHVVASRGDAVDLVLDGGPCPTGLESTVLDVRGDSPIILRPGSLGLAALRAVDPRVDYAKGASVSSDAPRPSPGMDLRHYAPRAKLILAASREAAVAEAEARAARGEAVGLVLRGVGNSPAPGVSELPDDPSAYAHLLYATLHDLDGAGVVSIVVQAVPETDAWRAVADRLARASAG
jgi:L-threonylcarbamoyladenylate synthase